MLAHVIYLVQWAMHFVLKFDSPTWYVDYIFDYGFAQNIP